MKSKLSILVLLAALCGIPSDVHGQAAIQMFCGGTLDPTQQLKFVGGCSYANGVMTITAAGGTVTSISEDALQNITLTPNPITTTGTVGLNLAASDTWVGLHTFSQALVGQTSGSPNGTAFGPSFTGNAGGGTNSDTPIVLNITPTFNLQGTTNNSGYTAILVNATQTNIGSGAKKLIDLEVGNASKYYVTNTGSWFSPLVDSGVTTSGSFTLAANTNFDGTAGTGALRLNMMTGSSDFPTGNFSWAGAAAASGNLTAGAGAAITIDAGTFVQLGPTAASAINFGNVKTVVTTATGLITKYNNETTAATGVPYSLGVGQDQPSNGLGTQSTTIVSFSPAATGLYRVSTVCSTTTGDTVTTAVSFTDAVNTTATTLNPINAVNLGGNGTSSGIVFIRANTSTPIVAKITVSNANTTKCSAVIERMN